MRYHTHWMVAVARSRLYPITLFATAVAIGAASAAVTITTIVPTLTGTDHTIAFAAIGALAGYGALLGIAWLMDGACEAAFDEDTRGDRD